MKAVLEAIDRLIKRVERLEKAVKAPPREAYRPSEVATLTGIGYATVLEMCRTGELPAKQVGGGRLWIVPAAELRRYLNDTSGTTA
ncbi:helix-turn-helix domain-containing protein [Amycolatopsis roodepoortensis]|uniref:helix-turn-helix domain-containing protein n=1 Tax=Amycolatopsis roodepoortensis TaxID=700274 RepID=UPI00214D0302|nr:helix-turn-helix domain-containing protein [Amycolatopsis roodepoortensis]UUV34412.1 helix-turn-helix domain-containing protein [Amycolatopsis roodepoortensis]